MDHLHSIFWEDLDNAQTRIQQAMTALQSLQNAIQTGQIDQPTRQDSKRLNRLMVLAELLYAEIPLLHSRAAMALIKIQPLHRKIAYHQHWVGLYPTQKTSFIGLLPTSPNRLKLAP